MNLTSLIILMAKANGKQYAMFKAFSQITSGLTIGDFYTPVALLPVFL